MGFAYRMLCCHRSTQKLWRVAFAPARSYGGGGGGGGFSRPVLSSSGSNNPHRAMERPSFLGSRKAEKAPSTFSLMRRCFASHQSAAAAASTEQEEEMLLLSGTPKPLSPCLILPPGFVCDRDGQRIIPKKLVMGEGMDNKKDCFQFFSVGEKRMFEIEKNPRTIWLGEYLSPDNSKCVGSSHGWLAYINRHNCALYLFNPLIQTLSFPFPFIPLPPVETLPSVLSKIRQKSSSSSSSPTPPVAVTTEFVCSQRLSAVSSKELSAFLIKKFVLSSAPSPFPSDPNNNRGGAEEEDCTVMVIQGFESYQLAFCKPGDTCWTPLDGPLGEYDELVYFSKDQRFYALSFSESIEAWDLRDTANPRRELIKSAIPPYAQPTMDDTELDMRIGPPSKRYLVESSGDLLMVVRYFSVYDVDWPTPCSRRKTHAFDVYKLDFDNNNQWVYVPSLEDRVLFVGVSDSVSLSVRDFPELKANSIYFTCLEAENVEEPDGAYDLGVFSLEEKSITLIYQCNFNQINPPPIWVFPQL